MGSAKNLAISHSFVFLAGFAVGKYVDHEELMTYREANENFIDRFRRRAGNAAIGIVAIGTIGLLFRVTSRGSSKVTP